MLFPYYANHDPMFGGLILNWLITWTLKFFQWFAILERKQFLELEIPSYLSNDFNAAILSLNSCAIFLTKYNVKISDTQKYTRGLLSLSQKNPNNSMFQDLTDNVRRITNNADVIVSCSNRIIHGHSLNFTSFKDNDLHRFIYGGPSQVSIIIDVVI